MGAFFAKQPNGKFCKISTSADNFAKWEIEKDDLVQYFLDTDYNYCNVSIKDNYMLKTMANEMENPPEEGRFVSSFEEALCSLSMNNYKNIGEIRDLLKMMGYNKWNTFMTWDYTAGYMMQQEFNKRFDEFKAIIKNYLMPPETLSPKDCCYNYYSSIFKKGTVTSLSEIKEIVCKIEALDDFYNYYRNILKYSEDRITLNFFHLSGEIKEFNSFIDSKQINDAFNAQFENHSYIEVV